MADEVGDFLQRAMTVVMVMVMTVMMTVIVMRMRMYGLLGDAEVRRGDAGAKHLRDVQFGVDAERPKRAAELVGRQAGVEERAEDHVPRGARRAFEIEHSSH